MPKLPQIIPQNVDTFVNIRGRLLLKWTYILLQKAIFEDNEARHVFNLSYLYPFLYFVTAKTKMKWNILRQILRIPIESIENS